MATKTEPKAPDTTLQERKATPAERFTANITTQFEAEAGSPVALTDYERRLAQHLFVRIDATMKELEAKRTDKTKPPIVWQNVNMQKLALDAVNRVQLGLDALLPATIYPIPYLNGKTNLYDLDLRIGYRGEDYYRREVAVDPPIDIRYELVHATDVFKPIMRSGKQIREDYEFEIKSPFDRGEIIGGFAYIMYSDESKNKLVMVSKAQFEKSRKVAKAGDFWNNWYEEMCYKTLIHRATSHLTPDPKKVNAAAYVYVDEQERNASASAAQREADRLENTEDLPIPPIEGEFMPDDSPSAPEPPEPLPDEADGDPGF
jgi:recombination protein RecT